MDKVHKLTDDLLHFIDSSPTSYHAASNIIENLEAKGYKPLREDSRWDIKPGGRYYVSRNDSAVIAFAAGLKNPSETGFRIIGAHTDSPLMKIKHEAENRNGNYARITVEVYGGPIVSTWLDRELSVAGRVMVKEGDGLVSRTIRLNKPVAIIPNAAIHMNREINKGFEYNKQTHLPAIIAAGTEDAPEALLMEAIEKETGIKKEDIVDADLFLFDPAPGLYAGLHGEMISSGRLDDLAMCHSILNAMPEKESPKTCVGIFYDNEEIGSTTRQGADSTFLGELLQRLMNAYGGDSEEMYMAKARSFMISADMAHALHPNYAEKHDPAYAPRINKGPVIKLNANFRYATTAETAAFFQQICEKAGVPSQRMTNRSDMPSGSTIGPVSSALLGIKTVDVGNPMWGMHSIRETGGIHDHWYMTEAFKTFFSE